MTFVVKDIVGRPYCMSPFDGIKLFKAVEESLKTDGTVTLDFTDIEIYTASFFARFFSYFCKAFGRENIKDRFNFVNISGFGLDIAQAMITDAEHPMSFEVYKKTYGDYFDMDEDEEKEEYMQFTFLLERTIQAVAYVLAKSATAWMDFRRLLALL